MNHIALLMGIAAVFSVSACGGQTTPPQSPGTKAAPQPSAKPGVAAPKPASRPKSSLPAPGSAKGTGLRSKPVLPAPKVPGTISLERRISGGLAGDMLGRTAKSLLAQYGEPRLNIVEGDGQKLQYMTSKCVVDIYLYPPAAGKDAAVVHIDARDDQGRDLDRDMCVQQLARK